MDTKTPSTPTIVLVPGYWLGAWAWDAVAAELRGRGYHVIAVTLPGLDPNDPHRASATVAQQAEGLRSAVHAAADGSPVVLVAHSGAGYPTSVLLDQDPPRSPASSMSTAGHPVTAQPSTPQCHPRRRRCRCHRSSSCAQASTASAMKTLSGSAPRRCRSPDRSRGSRFTSRTTPGATSRRRSSPARTPQK